MKGVDERVAEFLATEEISVGDYVLSGGELPAAIVVDAVTRLLPGALGNEASTENESFSHLDPSEVAHTAADPRSPPSETPTRFPALHAASGIPRLEGARGPDRRQSCRSGQMAPPTGRREDTAKPARSVDARRRSNND